MEQRRVGTNVRWADIVGYSRAVRAGDHIYVGGTAAVGDDGHIVAPGDAYLQARRCLHIIVAALQELGATEHDVVRTRMFVRGPQYWQDVGRAHGEIFADVKPAATMVFCDFIDADMLVEIEADAVIGG